MRATTFWIRFDHLQVTGSRKKKRIKGNENTSVFVFIACEKIWPELIKTLYELQYNKSITDEVAYAQREYENTMLFRNDPATCACYYDYKVTKFMNIIKQDSFSLSILVEDSYKTE